MKCSTCNWASKVFLVFQGLSWVFFSLLKSVPPAEKNTYVFIACFTYRGCCHFRWQQISFHPERLDIIRLNRSIFKSDLVCQTFQLQSLSEVVQFSLPGKRSEKTDFASLSNCNFAATVLEKKPKCRFHWHFDAKPQNLKLQNITFWLFLGVKKFGFSRKETFWKSKVVRRIRVSSFAGWTGEIFQYINLFLEGELPLFLLWWAFLLSNSGGSHQANFWQRKFPLNAQGISSWQNSLGWIPLAMVVIQVSPSLLHFFFFSWLGWAEGTTHKYFLSLDPPASIQAAKSARPAHPALLPAQV